MTANVYGGALYISSRPDNSLINAATRNKSPLAFVVAAAVQIYELAADKSMRFGTLANHKTRSFSCITVTHKISSE